MKYEKIHQFSAVKKKNKLECSLGSLKYQKLGFVLSTVCAPSFQALHVASLLLTCDSSF